MSTLLKDLLDEKGVLLADGATGSNLFGMGLQTGDSPELWNTYHPDRIAQHYRNFVEAGSDIILTIPSVARISEWHCTEQVNVSKS